MLGLFIIMLLISMVPLIGYLYLVGDGVDWKGLGKLILKYGPIIFLYILITTLLNHWCIIPYNAGALLFTIWPLFIIYFGIKELRDKTRGDLSTAIVFLVFGFSFSLIIISSHLQNYVANKPDSILTSIYGFLSNIPAFLLVFFFPLLIVGILISYIFRDK